MAISIYISELRNALRTSGAHASYFPRDRKERKTQNLKLAREIGFGLKDFPLEQVNDILGTLYGKLIVANSLDTTGVAIDNKEWVTEIRSQLT